MKINLTRLMTCREELIQKDRELNEELQTVLQVQSKLKEETVLASYNSSLKKAAESLDEERRELWQLIRMIEQIVSMYARNERNAVRILEDGHCTSAPKRKVQRRAISFDTDVFQ